MTTHIDFMEKYGVQAYRSVVRDAIRQAYESALPKPAAVELATEGDSPGEAISNPGGQPLTIAPPIRGINNLGKKQLEAYVIDDIRQGGLTLQDLILGGILPGVASDYDLSGLTPSQIGDLPIGERARLGLK